jgi:4-amino-4-deoxy-L-arabinose transferase-like glycosyltransferase
VFAWNVGGPPLASFDEGIYASAAAGMLRYGYWLVPHFYWPHGDAVAFEAFLEKPPLAFWVEAVSMAVFGVNEWGARLPNAAYSILTGVVVYLFGREVVDRRAGVLSAAVFFTTTFVYAGWNAGRSGGVEPPFVFFGTLSVFGLWLAARSPDRRARYLAVAATAAAAATLVKGFAFGLYGVVTLPLLFRDRRLLFSRAGVGAALGYAALVVPWPLAAWVLHGDRFVDQLWAEQVLGRVTGGFISYPATFEFMSYPYFRWLPTFLDPWFLPLLVVAPVALLAPWLSPQCPDLDAPFLVWWVVVVVAFFVPTGNHGWYLMPLYPAAAVLLGGWFAAASRGLSVPAATTLLATGLALALSPRFAGGRPWDTFAVQPRIPGEGLRSMAIPDGPLAVLALAGGAALLVAAPAVRAWLRARLGGRADTALPVLGMAVVVLVVGATAAPVGLQDGTWTPAEKEFGTAVDDTAPPDATLFMTAGAMDPLHGGFAFFFYTNRPLSVISPDQMSSDTVQYAMLTRAELDGVSREATVLARHADRPRSGQAFEDRPAVEVVVVRFEGG